MSTLEELKKLSLEVARLQEDLIELGDVILRETGSFSSWLKSTFLSMNLPFDIMSRRADMLATDFENIYKQLQNFEDDSLRHLSEGRQELYTLLKQYCQLLYTTACILKRNQSEYHHASQGKNRISFGEVRRNSNEYNEATLKYAEVGARLQPYIDDLFNTCRRCRRGQPLTQDILSVSAGSALDTGHKGSR